MSDLAGVTAERVGAEEDRAAAQAASEAKSRAAGISSAPESDPRADAAVSHMQSLLASARGGMSFTPDPGISVFFTAEIDAIGLSSWTTCSGMGITHKHEARADAAMTVTMHHLHGPITYTDITLSRPVTPDSGGIITWMSVHSLLPIPTVAQITALNSAGGIVYTWSLWGVHPVKWQGPTFDAGAPKVATESLTIAYQGFL